MSQRQRGPNHPDALTPGTLDDVHRNLDALCVSISQLGQEQLPRLAASLASLRGAAARLVEAADAAASCSALLNLPRELLFRVLAECSAEDLARVGSCSWALHAAVPGTGMSLTNEAASKALAELPVELAALVPSGSSAARRLQLVRQLQESGEEWQEDILQSLASGVDGSMDAVPLVMPTLAREVGSCMEVIALRALDFPPSFGQDDDARSKVQRAAVKIMGTVWSDLMNPFMRMFERSVRTPPPGALVVRLLAEVVQAVHQPSAVRAMAEQLAVHMVPALVLNLHAGIPWRLQHMFESTYINRPSLGCPKGEFPEEEAKFQRAATLLRAVWERRRAAAGAAAALGVETLALGGNLAWLLAQLNQLQEAEDFLRQLIPILHDIQGARALDTMACHSLLLELLVTAGRWEEAGTLVIELPTGPYIDDPTSHNSLHLKYDVEKKIRLLAYRIDRELKKLQKCALQEQLLRACIALGCEWAEHHLKGLLVRQGRLDGVELLRKAMQEKDSAAPSQIQVGKADLGQLDLLGPTKAAVLHMRLVTHLDEKGRADDAAQERERLVVRYVEEMSAVHDQLLEADFEPSADVKRVRQLCHVPYGALRDSTDGENKGLRFCLRYRKDLVTVMADLDERVEALLSQRVAEAKEKHGADSLQAWCATARLMTLLDETKRTAAALRLARELMAVAERRLGSAATGTLEATAYVGVLCDDLGEIDEAVALTQQIYDALLNGDDEVRRLHVWERHMSLCDCGEQLACMLRRKGRHFEAADILKRLLVDLGEPLPEDDIDRHIHLKHELSLALVRCMFQTSCMLRTSCFPLIPRPHRSQESAGNLDEAAGVMAALVTQMDEGTTPLLRAQAIFRLSELRASTLIRLRVRLCAMKRSAGVAPPPAHVYSFCRVLQIQKAITAVSQKSGAFGSLSRAPQLCCCCATGSLAADWRLEGSLRTFASFTQASHVFSRNSSSSRATTATLPAGRS